MGHTHFDQMRVLRTTDANQTPFVRWPTDQIFDLLGFLRPGRDLCLRIRGVFSLLWSIRLQSTIAHASQLPVYIAPSITPVSGGNPAFRVYVYAQTRLKKKSAL